MQVFHTHWRPPATAGDSGAVLVWAEDATRPAPAKQRAAGKKPKPHPFAGVPEVLRQMLAATGLNPAAEKTATLTLLLPGGKYGPRPSPQLQHGWMLDDDDEPPLLSPWQIEAITLSPLAGFTFLNNLPRTEAMLPGVVLGADCLFWQAVIGLVLETLAAQKILPTAAQAGEVAFHARWMPVLDGPQDGPRLAKLQALMPPLCRAEAPSAEEAPPPRVLLDTFLNVFTDTLARYWGNVASPAIPRRDRESPQEWLLALFADNPLIAGSGAQLRHFSHSVKAWLRNLQLAGNRHYRVAFRLTAPAPQQSPEEATWELHYALQARHDPSLLVSAEQVWQTKGNVLTALDHCFEQPQEKLLAGLGYAARLFAPLKTGLKTAKPVSMPLSTAEAFDFLRHVAPLLEESGFGVLVPPWWNNPGARLGVRLKLSADAIPQSKLSFQNLIRYQWELSLGDTTLTKEEFEALVALKSPLVQIRGQWVMLDPEQIEAAIRFWEKQTLSGEIGLTEALRLSMGGADSVDGLPVEDVAAEGWFMEWLNRFSGEEKLAQLSPPQSLRAQLRPYQLYGYSWLDFMRRWGMGACLADDMGLGKTIQTLTMLLREQETAGTLPGPVLLICPTSVVANWAKETARFAPSLVIFQHQGAERLRDEEFIRAVSNADLVLSSYAVVRRDAEVMRAVNWFGVILDEAQNIKNPGAKQTQVIRGLNAQFRLALTGTPVENRLSELWSIMHFLNPGYLGNRTDFRANFALPIERYNNEDVTARLRKLTTPFILRRVKTDPTVIQDLPEKNEMKVYCTLSEEQATLYESVVQDSIKVMEGMSETGIERKGIVLSMLMKLKQVCNHPAQFLHQMGGGAAPDPAMELKRSGKLARLTEMLEECVSVGDRALIFSQFAEMGDYLQSHLQQSLGVPVVFLHGGVPAKKRAQMVERFQDDLNGPPIFILSLKAGGTGLNLTRASHVFHFDRWWNPAVENQATDRAFRIGQKKNVQVHKFVCAGTLEEMIDEMIESKKALAESVIGGGEGWLTELSTADLRQLVALRREAVA